ncbi:MAG: Rieske 2Fe-2S domain-containing protein [Coriobacteriia bacterium]|nr:Rieske 2Fe-2S domain-containing protein [Coriobacteriia bacterium]
MSGASDRPRRQLFHPGTTIDDLKAYMGPFVATLGYRFNSDDEFVEAVLTAELGILETAGDVYCPCRIRTGDPKEDAQIVCPCIPFHREQFAAIRKCWCGLFVRTDVEDDTELCGVIDEPGPGQEVDVPVCRASDLAPGTVRHVKIGKTDLAVVRVGDEFHAVSNVCRHAFAPLSDGIVEGYELVCPWHGWRYDVRDGTTDHPGADLRVYPLFVVNECVMIRLSV